MDPVVTTADRDALVVASMRRWVADDFATATEAAGLRLVHTFGIELPDALGELVRPAWWAPTEYAARAQVAGVSLPLVSPGPAWHEHLSPGLLGRGVHGFTLDELAGDAGLRNRAGFVKLAEVKHPTLEARWYHRVGDFVDGARAAGLPGASRLQLCFEWRDFIQEHRLFVRDAQVVASSPYLLEGDLWDPGMAADPRADAASAEAFGAEAVAAFGDQPPAWVLDVGRTKAGWAVVEANPCWSAGLYDAAPDAVLSVLCAAIDHEGAFPAWHWVPDPFLAERAAAMVRLPGPTGARGA